MVLVCLSHFSVVYLARHSASLLSELPILLGLVASPTFALMSGTMLGMLYVVQRRSFAALRAKLIDRSIFLLTIAHALIACSRLAFETHPLDALRMMFMTDAIGVSVIIGLFLIARTKPATRLFLGAALYAVSCELALFWRPHGIKLEFVRELLIGADPSQLLVYGVPIAPWLGLYLACTALGERLGGLYQRQDTHGVERTLFATGMLATNAGVGLRVLGWRLAPLAITLRHRDFMRIIAPAFSPTTKLPPGPVYLLFFGGLGLLLIWGVATLDHRGHLEFAMRWSAMLGRCSLVVFIVQFYVYYTLIGPARFPYTRGWPLLFAGSIAVISAIAAWWDRHQLNSLLTVGLPNGGRWRNGLPERVGGALARL